MSDEPDERPEEWAPREEPGADGDGGSGRTGVRRLLPTWRMVVGAALLVVLMISGGMVAGYLLVEVPEPNDHAVAESNVYLYSDGSTRIAVAGEYNRAKIPLSEISLAAQHAMLAAEDRNFYDEPAVNVTAMARAAWNMLTGGQKQSGSTITQQYVKNYYLTQEQTVSRKVREFFIAIKVDSEVSKDEILQGYLNTSYFGRNAYGIESAAHAYYGKEASELTVGEGAYLAALVNAPSALDTRAHPDNKDRALFRWNYVLDGMVEEGWLSEAKRTGMKFPEPDPLKPSTGLSGQRGYLVNAVNDHLVDSGVVSRKRLEAGGFTITTTIDREKQDAMVDAVHEQLVSQLDSEREVDSYVRVGGTSIDPQTGEVVAMYGGQNYVEQFVNNATRRDYQVGSTFKPFVLASALKNGSTTQDGRPITPRTRYDGTTGQMVMRDGEPTGYHPHNEDHESFGSITVTEAMQKSVNAVFAQMGVDVGPENVKETAIALGLPEETPNLKAHPSISLGVATASTLDMAEAYTTLANHGVHRDHTMVTKVTSGHRTLELPERKSERVVPLQAADTTTAVLETVVEDGFGAAAQAAGRPAAGKTGTAAEDKAAWFAGYTPELVTVVAVMGQNPETGAQEPLYGAAGLPRVNGGGPPAEIWAAYTAAALEGEPVQDFDLETGGPLMPTAPPTEEAEPTGPPTTVAPTEPPTDELPTDPGFPTQPTGPPTIPTSPATPPDATVGGGWGGTTDGGTTGGTDGGTTSDPGDPGGGTTGTTGEPGDPGGTSTGSTTSDPGSTGGTTDGPGSTTGAETGG